MADFEDALNTLLADPDAMGQIMALAGKLGGGGSPSPLSGEEPPPPAEPPAFPDIEQLGKMGKILELLQTSGQTKQETLDLLTALRPFLRSSQQAKLDRAMRLAGLSKAAKQVYQLWKEGELHV